MKAPVLLLTIVLVSLAAGAFAFSGGSAHPAPSAAQGPWLIRVFDATYNIKPDGRVEVREAIKVDFSGLDVDGMYRTLPLGMNYLGHDGQSRRRALEIDVEEVTAYSEPVPFTIKQAGGNLVLGIDRDCTCRTQIEYEILYTIEGALESIDGADRFRWNVTGLWPVDILRTDARVIAPAIHDANCSLHSDEANSGCDTRFESENDVVFLAGQLPHGLSMAINVALPHGAVEVAPPLLVGPKAQWLGSPASLTLAGGLALLLLSIVLLVRARAPNRPPK